MQAAIDFQGLHDRDNPDAMPVGPPCVVLVKVAYLRKAIVAEMIASGTEPDEAAISTIADALAPWTIIVATPDGLAIRDVGPGADVAELIRLHLRTGYLPQSPESVAARLADQPPTNGYLA